MNYLEKLLPDDVELICKLIGSKKLKQNFQANSNGFSTIKPGFRPNTVSDEAAISLTAQNSSMRFISKFFIRTTLIISKKPGNTGISRDIRTEFTTDLLLSD